MLDSLGRRGSKQLDGRLPEREGSAAGSAGVTPASALAVVEGTRQSVSPASASVSVAFLTSDRHAA